MKTLVIGPGVIGATYAWQLSRSGQNVTLLVRRGQKSQYEQNGITIRCTDERKKPAENIETVYRPAVIDEMPLHHDFELIMVCVRSHQLSPILPELAERARQADVLFFQNNWRSDAEVRACLPASQYLFGFSRLVGGWRTGMSINCMIGNAPGQATMLGEVSGEVTPRVRRLQQMFASTGLKPEVSRDILGWMACHYVEYLGPVGAILKAGSARAFAESSALMREMILATREGLAVCRARGINVGQAAPINLRLFSLPLALIVPIGQANYRAPNIQQFFEENIAHGMEEVAIQYYEVLNDGKRLGVPMPHMEALEPYYRKYHPGVH
jgi:ketopantoate reductase